jgi:hypothetical protein
MDSGKLSGMLALYLPAFRGVGRHCVEEPGRLPVAYRFLEYPGEIVTQIRIQLENQSVLGS